MTGASSERWRFASIELREPSKAIVREFTAGGPIRREAVAVCWNRDDGQVYKAYLSLTDDRVLSWEHQPDGQPNMTVDEFTECDATLRRDPRVIRALADRGITDMDRVLIDTWAYGAHLVPEAHRGGRLGWADVWYRSAPGSSPYANPVTGLHFVVDLNRMELLEVEDLHRVDEPQTMGEYVPHLVPGLEQRDDLKPLEIVAARRASRSAWTATCCGGRSGRCGSASTTARAWCCTRSATTTAAARARSPTGSRSPRWSSPTAIPTTDHYRRTAFDIGEWGLGFMTTSLELGCDCLGDIAYLDAVMHDTRGEPYTIRNAICIHEEDDAMLWKHVDAQVGAETRRARRLVLSFHVTVANYEYLVYWRLYQDGNIECEVRATGIMVTTHFAEGAQPPYGTLVDERTYAPFHQHFLVARLDLDVDGEANTVYATESEALPIGPDEPARPRARAARHAAAHGVRGQAGLRLEHPAGVEGGQRERRQRARDAGRVQARARRQRSRR